MVGSSSAGVSVLPQIIQERIEFPAPPEKMFGAAWVT